MIINGMGDVFSIIDQQNKNNEWVIILHQSRFLLEYMKVHVHSILKGSETDQYIVQNLTWSEVYLSSNLSNDIIHEVMTLVPLTAT